MKFEVAISHLRDGHRIYRSTEPEKGSLCGTVEKVYGSFYLTIYDVLAEDWQICIQEED